MPPSGTLPPKGSVPPKGALPPKGFQGWSFTSTILAPKSYSTYTSFTQMGTIPNLSIWYIPGRELEFNTSTGQLPEKLLLPVSSASRHRQFILTFGLTKIIIVKENFTSNRISKASRNFCFQCLALLDTVK